MKTILSFYLILSSLSTISKAQTTLSNTDSLQLSPEFEFITLSGQEVLSKDLKGKVIVLDFWNSTCKPCKKSMPQIEKFYQQYENDQRVVVYLVNSGWETIDKAKSFAESGRSSFLFIPTGDKYDLPFAYDKESATMNAFKLESNPSTIIIDSSFRVRVKHSAFIDNYCDFLIKHVEQYLAEK
jgi:thiol-disulfide isomerase/thioredoxin